MSNKERLPKLVDVYHEDSDQSDSESKTILHRRQLPLVVDDNLTLVMDLNGSGIVCDNQLVRGRELEEFTRKYELLTKSEVKAALQITKLELMNVLNHTVPCVGCRRSVERLYHQLHRLGHPTLQPLTVEPDGTITIQGNIQGRPEPQVLCSIFRNHTTHLDKLIENQPKRSKKSQRCLLHSLDSQRSRPLTPIWKDVWNCLLANCKKEVCIIEAHVLHTTLDSYLRKHRFCGDCKTKVLKAYSLLMEEDEPEKEKGYVPGLYANIRRCIPEKHIHLSHQHNYITKLINRAEPELFGSRRERHAKTLEIAQEEVLTCLGICMYERLHRIYMRIREEECTCQVFAAVAVDTLSRSFETAVERKQGRSQLELLFEEFSREERKEQIRKEQKKIKRKRKKGGKAVEQEEEGKENNSCCCIIDEDDDEKDDHHHHPSANATNTTAANNTTINNISTTMCTCTHNKNDSDCYDVDVDGGGVGGGGGGGGDGDTLGGDSCCGGGQTDWIKDCKCDQEEEEDIIIDENNKKNSMLYFNNNKKDNDNGGLLVTTSRGSHPRACGYSENNNRCCETGSVISSASSTSEGSELACSDGGYQQDIDMWSNGRYGHYQSIQDMLQTIEVQGDCDDNDSKLTPEEVREFENNHQHLFQKRQELRAVLRKKFLDFCHCYGHSQVPRILLQTKYASN